MKYKLRNNYPRDSLLALPSILRDRGVEDVNAFMNPEKEQELSPYDLDNIEDAAKMLLRHLRKNSDILFVVDCDCDGFTSSAILWLYIKKIFPQSKLYFTVHEHKSHGLEDKIDWLIDDQQFDLVICADSASYNVKEVERLAEINTDVLILD